MPGPRTSRSSLRPRSHASCRLLAAFAAGAVLAALGAVAAAAPPRGLSEADWPQLLGPHRNGALPDVRIAGDWPESGLPERWRREVGAGFAGPVAVGERVLLFHRRADEEVVEAFDAADGRSLWTTAYPTDYRDDFGFDEGPRSVPTVAGGRIFSFGAQGVLQALELETGRRLWHVDTRRDFGTAKGFFGVACSPLVDGDRVIVNVGGADGAGIVAFAAASGEVLWKATDHGASYSSPVLGRFGDRPTVLAFTRRGLVALDPEGGEVLAEMRWRSRSNASVNAASPLVVGERVFVSASYGTGATLVNLGPAGFVPVWASDRSLSTHYATAVHRAGVLFGFHGALHLGSPDLRAVDLESGEVLWSRERFGGGTALVAGGRLLVARDDGELFLAPATGTEFRPLARARILEGTVRAFPALSRGTLYARDERHLVAVELPLETSGELPADEHLDDRQQLLTPGIQGPDPAVGSQ